MEPIDTPEGLLVHADWLLAQGNVQGELISLQHSRQTSVKSPAAQRALRLREEELIGKHAGQMVGPVPEGARLCWRMGFVRELAVRVDVAGSEPLAEILSRPAFALLESLHVNLTANFNDVDPAAKVLAALAARPGLRAFGLELHHASSLELSMLPAGLERLSVRAVLSNVTLPELARLTALELHCDTVEGLSPGRQPRLRQVDTGLLDAFEGFSGLELHLDDVAPDTDELAAMQPRRVVITLAEDGAFPAGPWSVRTSEQAGERAFLLLDASETEVSRALARLVELPFDGVLVSAHREWQLGGRRVCAVELRSNEPQPTLLRTLAVDLADQLGRGVVEVAVSESSSAALFRAHERVGTSVATWVLARTNRTDAADAMRRAVDRLLSFDPGLTALDDVLLVLDGAAPSLRRGDARLDGFQLPCCTPVESSFETYEEEEDPEEDELGEADDPWVDENVVGQLDVAITELPPEEEEPEEDPEDDPDEPHHDATDASIEQLLTQSPVDLDEAGEEDGLERDTDHGLDLGPPDPDGLSPTVLCSACRLNESLDTCQLCGAETCEACSAGELPFVCKECRSGALEPISASPRPRTR